VIDGGGLIIATAPALRSLVTQYLHFYLDQSVHHAELKKALERVFTGWRKRGVAVVDDEDVVNIEDEVQVGIGVGSTEAPATDSATAWSVALVLLVGVLSLDSAEERERFVSGEFSADFRKPAEKALKLLRKTIAKGVARRAFVGTPHMRLVDRAFYNADVKPLLADFVVLWMQQRPEFSGLSKTHARTFLIHEDNMDIETVIAASQTCPGMARPTLRRQRSSVLEVLGPHIPFMSWCYDWLHVFLPFVLSCVNGSDYGLIPDTFAKCSWRFPPAQDLASVPFDGRNQPSLSCAAFVLADVEIGLTALAYRHQGLRKSDVKRIVSLLKAESSRTDTAYFRSEAHWMFDEWLRPYTAK
jgi:hypothetical protein